MCPRVSATPALIEAAGLVKNYAVRDARWGRRRILGALSGLSFRLEEGENLGVVGESGSGKTTLGKIVAGLLEPTGGSLVLAGRDARTYGRRERARFAQMVFQDPATALNPKLTVGTQIGEALRTRSGKIPASAEAGVWLEKVGLTRDMLSAYPHQLSGGQRQRVNIARAAAAGPRLIIADEPVSSLDLSIQAQILKLLADLKSSLGISYLVISHDLSVVGALCDRMIVLKTGALQEEGPTAELLARPSHPYTRTLVESVPRMKKR